MIIKTNKQNAVANLEDDFLIKMKDVSLHVPTRTVKERNESINPLRLMAQFYGNSSGRSFNSLLLNLNLVVSRGERIGIIGQNGAGKTTLLRLLAGIYRPSSGELMINGQAFGLFNIQLGMNPSATGIENIYLRGLQMGLTLAEIRSQIDEITKFTELGSSLNELFGNYSTGMKLRLAFAISTILKPDILLMDEWIGSGDENFKQKVQVRMNEMVAESKSLIVATHSVQLIKRLCTHGIVLKEGRILFHGPVKEALRVYRESVKSVDLSIKNLS